MPCKASWKLNGTPDVMEAEIPVRINAGMGSDAILGKAERKMRARIYNRITGTEFPEGEVGDVVVEKPVGSGSTSGARTVSMPKAKQQEGAAVEAEIVTRTEAEILEIDVLAEEAGIPPMNMLDACRRMFQWQDSRPPD